MATPAGGAGPAAPLRPKRRLPGPSRGLLLLLSISIVWGFNWPVLKIGMAEIPPFTFRGGLFVVGGFGLLLFCRALGYSLAVPRRHWPALALMTLLMAAIQVLSGYGVLHTSAGRAAVIVYTMPVWGLVFGVLLLREAVTWRATVSLVLALGGLGALIADDVAALSAAPVGFLFMIATAVSWGLATVVQKKVDWGVPTLVLVTWQAVLGSLPLAIGAAILDHDQVQVPGIWAILAFLYNVVPALIFGFYAYFEAVRLFPVAITTIGVMLTPVIGVISGALVLGEPIGTPEIVALLLVIAAIGVPVFTRARAIPP